MGPLTVPGDCEPISPSGAAQNALQDMGESQTGGAADARRQLTGRAQAAARIHHRFAPWLRGVFQPKPRD